MDKEIKSFLCIDSYRRWMWLKKLSKLEFLAIGFTNDGIWREVGWLFKNDASQQLSSSFLSMKP